MAGAGNGAGVGAAAKAGEGGAPKAGKGGCAGTGAGLPATGSPQRVEDVISSLTRLNRFA